MPEKTIPEIGGRSHLSACRCGTSFQVVQKLSPLVYQNKGEELERETVESENQTES